MLDFTNEEYFEGDGQNGQGYYSFITLDDLVTNFMIGYTGPNTTVGDVDRYRVEFFGKRAVQEFSYDVVSEKTWEYELNSGQLSIPLPQDFVKEVRLAWVDDNGYERTIQRRRDSGDPSSPLTNEEGLFLFDNEGALLYATPSQTRQRFEERQTEVSTDTGGYLAGYLQGDGYTDSVYYQYGKRYGINPEHATVNGSYLINKEFGTVSFSGDLANSVITIQYVSDGLSDDDSEIRMPKVLEQAMYDLMTYQMIQNRSDVPLYEKQSAKRSKTASYQNAKIRLYGANYKELIQTLRGQTKWIKN